MGDIHHPGIVPLRSRRSFLAIERGTLHASSHSLLWQRESGTIVIPVGMTTVLLVEPGVSITRAAIKLCAEQGTRFPALRGLQVMPPRPKDDMTGFPTLWG